MDIAFRQHIPLFNLLFRDYISFDDIIGGGENSTSERAVERFLRAQRVIQNVKIGYEDALDVLGLKYFKPSDTVGLIQRLELKMKKAQALLGELESFGSLFGGLELRSLNQMDLSALDDAEKYKDKLQNAKKELGKVRKLVDDLESAKENVERELKEAEDKIKHGLKKAEDEVKHGLKKAEDEVKKGVDKLKDEGKKLLDKWLGRRRKRDLSGDITGIEGDIDSVISGLDKLKDVKRTLEKVKVSGLSDTLDDVFEQIAGAKKFVDNAVKFFESTNDTLHQGGIAAVLRKYDSMPDFILGTPVKPGESAIDLLIRRRLPQSERFFGAWAKHMNTTFGKLKDTY